MAVWIFSLLLVTLLYVSLPALLRRTAPDRPFSVTPGEAEDVGGLRLTRAYVVVSCALLALLLLQNVASSDPRLVARARSVQFAGVAASVPATGRAHAWIQILGDAVRPGGDLGEGPSAAFRWAALGHGQAIDLKPEFSGDRIVAYVASCHGVPYAVRLNGTSLNLPEGGWIEPGHSQEFQIRVHRSGTDAQGRPVASDTTLPFEIKVDDRTVTVISDYDPHPLTTRLVDAQKLGDLLESAHAEELRQRLGDLKDEAGNSILSRLVVMRREGASSPVGLVAAFGSAATGRVDAPPSSPPTLEAPGGTPASTVRIVPKGDEGGFRLSVAGAAGSTGLLLPGHADPKDEDRLAFEFDPPLSYPLPPLQEREERSKPREIVLVSSVGTVGRSGYAFDVGRPDNPIVVTARFVGDPLRLETYGPAAKESLGWTARGGDGFPLGESGVVPIVRFADPFRAARGAWLMPLAGIVGGGLILLAVLFGPLRDISKSPLVFVLWVGSMALLVVRCVLAYRVTTLPPLDIDSLTQGAYQTPWLYARWATLVFGLGGAAGAAFLAMGLEHTGRTRGGPEDRVRQAGAYGFFGKARVAFYLLALGQAVLVLLRKLFELPLPLSKPQYLQFATLWLVAGFACAGLSHDWDTPLTPGGGPRAAYPPRVRTAILTMFGVVGVLVLAVALSLRFPPSRFLLLEVGVGFLAILLSHPDRTAWLMRWALPLSAIALFFADSGSFVYGVPLLVAALLGGQVRRVVRARPTPRGVGPPRAFDLATARQLWLRGSAMVAVWAIVGGILVLPLLRPSLAKLGRETALGRGSSLLGFSGALPYRLAAGDPPAAMASLVDDEAPGNRFDPREMRNTLMQQWQMRSYVRASGAGYFAAPLSKVGMNYSTMLSDASFSVFLVGEHGKWAAFCVLGLHVLLAFVFWSAADRAARSRRRPGNVMALYAIGGIFGFAAIYMALANLWLVPFTGQNMPLLSLRSVVDLILFFGLITIGGFLIAFPFGHDGEPAAAPQQALNRLAPTFWALPVALVLGWVFAGGALRTERGLPGEPFNLDDTTYARIVAALDRGRREQQAAQSPNLADTPSVRAAAKFLAPFARALQAGNESGAPVLRGRQEDSLRPNRHFFYTASPFDPDEGVAWRGGLLAIPPPPSYGLLVAGRDEPIVLSDARHATDKLTLGGEPPRKDEVQELTFFDEGGVNYGGIAFEHGVVTLAYDDTGPGKQYRIYVNGARLALKDRRVILRPGDVVSLRIDGREGSRSASVTYVGPRDGRIAATVWRNGKYRRVFPQGADLPLAYAIGQAADDLSSDRGKPLGDLRLSLDLGLQHRLQNVLQQWGRENDRAIDASRHSGEGLPFTSVAVLDSHSGALRGLASIPRRDPNEDFEQVQRDFPNPSDAFVAARSSWAFQNRTVGSAFKPLSFAALASRLNGPGFDLANLTVNEVSALSDGRYRQLGDLSLSPGVAAAANNQPVTTMDRYLRESRTWPAVVTATLGLVDDRNRLGEMLHVGEGRSVGYGGRAASITPRAALGAAWLKGKRLGSQTVAGSLFMKGLLDCYGPNIVPFTRPAESLREQGLGDTFLKPLRLDDPRVTVQSLVCPDPHWANATLLTNYDLQLVRYMFGGGECRWSAVVMAANAARLTTGLRIVPTLGEGVAPEGPMPAPISDPGWRYAHLLTPLLNITTFAQAEEIRTRARSQGLTIAMKSGTIDDGDGTESEMLMFTVGEFRDKAFVPGRSLSGFLSIRASKRAEGQGSEMVKGELGKRVFEVLEEYLRR